MSWKAEIIVTDKLHYRKRLASADNACCYVAQNDTHGRPASRDAMMGYEPGRGETGMASRLGIAE